MRSLLLLLLFTLPLHAKTQSATTLTVTIKSFDCWDYCHLGFIDAKGKRDSMICAQGALCTRLNKALEAGKLKSFINKKANLRLESVFFEQAGQKMQAIVGGEMADKKL